MCPAEPWDDKKILDKLGKKKRKIGMFMILIGVMFGSMCLYGIYVLVTVGNYPPAILLVFTFIIMMAIMYFFVEYEFLNLEMSLKYQGWYHLNEILTSGMLVAWVFTFGFGALMITYNLSLAYIIDNPMKEILRMVLIVTGLSIGLYCITLILNRIPIYFFREFEIEYQEVLYLIEQNRQYIIPGSEYVLKKRQILIKQDQQQVKFNKTSEKMQVMVWVSTPYSTNEENQRLRGAVDAVLEGRLQRPQFGNLVATGLKRLEPKSPPGIPSQVEGGESTTAAEVAAPEGKAAEEAEG